MARQIVVKLVGNLVQLVQSSPRNGREIMVFVVQADIVSEQIERSVVRERLGDGRVAGGIFGGFVGEALAVEDVVLGDEVARTGVQGAGQEGRGDEIVERVCAAESYKGHVECHLGGDVEGVDSCQGQLVDHHWAEGVEEDLEGAEEGFSGNGIEEEGFESGGEVSVKAVDA